MNDANDASGPPGGPPGTPPYGAPEEAHTVLDALSRRTGVAPKILLRDEDSAHATSPVIDAAGAASLRPARGRTHYQILGKIAEGGMGAVFKSHDGDLGRDVAMKVLLDKHADKPAVMQRFVEEAQIGGQLQHPGIVPVYDLGMMADDRPFFTMKLVKGRTLAALLAERKGEPGERRRFLKVFEQVCETVAYAHSRRVVHRDLKPANIMVGAFGEVQVVDWGLGKVLTDGGVDDERAAKRALTDVSIIETLRSTGSSTGSESLVGSVMGTPMYMSPEQARGDVDRLDERTDVFGLGAILCEILTGKPPYVGEQDAIVIEAARAMQDGMRERLAASAVDAFLVDLVERCLAPNQAVRPRNSGVLLEELSTWLADQEQRARDAEVAEARAAEEAKRRRVTLVLACTIIVALAAGAWAWQRMERGALLRRASVAREVDDLLAQAQLQRGGGDLDAALASVGAAERIVSASPDAPDDLALHVAELETEVRADIATRTAAVSEQQRIDDFVARLDDLLWNMMIPVDDPRSRSQYEAFTAVFSDFGIDVDGDLGAQSDELVAVGRPELLGSAIDMWALATLDVRGFGDDYARILDFASVVDPDPARREVRRALIADDRDAFERLATSADAAATWTPVTGMTFAESVRRLGHRVIEMRPLLRAISARHPSDGRLHSRIALFDLWQSRSRDPERGLYHASAAYAAFPELPPVALGLARAFAVNDLPADAVALTKHVFTTMEWELLDYQRGGLYIINPLRDGKHFDHVVELREDLLERFPDESEALADLAWDLLNVSEPTREQMSRSRETALRSMTLNAESAAAWNTVAVAAWQLGEPQAALDAVERSLALATTDFACDHAVHALALEALGRRDEAEASYRRSLRADVQPFDPAEFRIGEEAAAVFGDA